MKLLLNLVCVVTLNIWSIATIASDDHIDHQSHGAHQHGVAQLLIMKDSTALQLELRSPAANLLGFERAAHSRKEQVAVADLRKKLMAVQSLFGFDSDTCKLQQARIDTTTVEGAEAEHQDHDKSKVDHVKSEHGDVIAVYNYLCDNNTKLKSVNVELLVHFPGITTLEVQSMVDGQQQAITLNQNKRFISF